MKKLAVYGKKDGSVGRPTADQRIVVCYTLVDDDIYDLLEGKALHIGNHHGHITFKQDGYSVYLHRFVAETLFERGAGKVVHHINENPLDNRRENLQVITHAEHQTLHAVIRSLSKPPKIKVRKELSSRNKSGYRYISWDAASGSWMVRVNRQGTRKYLGVYDVIEDAVRIRDEYLEAVA